MKTFVFVLITVALPLLLAEFGEWSPWLARRLIRWSSRRLGDAALAARYAEEWEAELETVPGKVSKLLVALARVVSLPWILRSTRDLRHPGGAPHGNGLTWVVRFLRLRWPTLAGATSFAVILVSASVFDTPSMDADSFLVRMQGFLFFLTFIFLLWGQGLVSILAKEAEAARESSRPDAADEPRSLSG